MITAALLTALASKLQTAAAGGGAGGGLVDGELATSRDRLWLPLPDGDTEQVMPSVPLFGTLECGFDPDADIPEAPVVTAVVLEYRANDKRPDPAYPDDRTKDTVQACVYWQTKVPEFVTATGPWYGSAGPIVGARVGVGGVDGGNKRVILSAEYLDEEQRAIGTGSGAFTNTLIAVASVQWDFPNALPKKETYALRYSRFLALNEQVRAIIRSSLGLPTNRVGFTRTSFSYTLRGGTWTYTAHNVIKSQQYGI